MIKQKGVKVQRWMNDKHTATTWYAYDNKCFVTMEGICERSPISPISSISLISSVDPMYVWSVKYYTLDGRRGTAAFPYDNNIFFWMNSLIDDLFCDEYKIRGLYK